MVITLHPKRLLHLQPGDYFTIKDSKDLFLVLDEPPNQEMQQTCNITTYKINKFHIHTPIESVIKRPIWSK